MILAALFYLPMVVSLGAIAGLLALARVATERTIKFRTAGPLLVILSGLLKMDHLLLRSDRFPLPASRKIGTDWQKAITDDVQFLFLNSACGIDRFFVTVRNG